MWPGRLGPSPFEVAIAGGSPRSRIAPREEGCPSSPLFGRPARLCLAPPPAPLGVLFRAPIEGFKRRVRSSRSRWSCWRCFRRRGPHRRRESRRSRPAGGPVKPVPVCGRGRDLPRRVFTRVRNNEAAWQLAFVKSSSPLGLPLLCRSGFSSRKNCAVLSHASCCSLFCWNGGPADAWPARHWNAWRGAGP